MSTLQIANISITEMQKRIKRHNTIVKNTALKFKSDKKLFDAIMHEFTAPTELDLFKIVIHNNTLSTKQRYYNQYDTIIKTEFLENNPVYTAQAVRTFIWDYKDKEAQHKIIALNAQIIENRAKIVEAQTLEEQATTLQTEKEKATNKLTELRQLRKTRKLTKTTQPTT